MSKPISVQRYRCLRCGHTWITRIATLPKRCPGKTCKSIYWDTKRTRTAPSDPDTTK